MRHFVDDDPLDSRIYIPNIEIYITNVCNLTCTNCNRFNNYDFKGWQRWSDYADQYAEWATKIRLRQITLLGGEPLLNPTVVDWVEGINKLWKKRVQILTNGTRINHVPGLYELLLREPDPTDPWKKNWIGISLHNPNDRDRCFDEIRQFLKGDIKYYHKGDPKNHDNYLTYGGTHAFIDSNNVKIPVWEYDEFHSSSLHFNDKGLHTLYNSDPNEAHSVCGFAQYKSYHFIKAKLYKCGPVALFPEFDKQFNLDISSSDRELLNSYQPLSITDFDSNGVNFINNIDNAIPQCKFCPTKFENIKLMAVSKKTNSTSTYD